MPDPDLKSFIETQLPVSKLSKECYKERKANYSQTLTGLGKWWGRKPLILVRATILGLLMPASNDPKRDREIFLKILTMDDQGLYQRKTKNIPLKVIYERLNPKERERWFGEDADAEKPRFVTGTTKAEKESVQRRVFEQMTYDEKLEYCDRPEQIEGPPEAAWNEINAHLGTHARALPELVRELGEKRFGHVPRVGDAFCGGGSIPFEAARIGCEAYGSDLNPVAALLTWGALNIVGGGQEVADQVREAQRQVYDDVDRQITEWGIEHNEDGDRADAYLYCCESRCPECGWNIPLAPSWVIGEKTRCVAVLKPDSKHKRYDIEIRSGVSDADMHVAKVSGTVGDSDLICPNPECEKRTPITMLRGDRRGKDGLEYGLRMWENDDVVPRPDDVFQERLYCIRYVHTWTDENGKEQRERYYVAPTKQDLARETRVLELLRDRFHDWQEAGYIPSAMIEPGYNTDQPMRERGWTHWHHLFNPRQLLVLGLYNQKIVCAKDHEAIRVAMLLGLGKCLDWNSKLSVWDKSAGNERLANTFLNQAFNTLFNMGCRPNEMISHSWFWDYPVNEVKSQNSIDVIDCRSIQKQNDIWITDPPYADAINYHELSEFFIAWYKPAIKKIFPHWYTESKSALAVRGKDASFKQSMVECYSRLRSHTADNGLQLVTFTHQDASVWADLALILWAAGLRVTGAWCVVTETDSALKEGNYVQGTVLLILRKQVSEETIYLDEIIPEVEQEVRAQLDSMLSLENQEDPNFSDTDYQLAAYAAALRVLTRYRNIEDIDVKHELSRERAKGETSKIEEIIENAVKVACDHLVPLGFDSFTWKTLLPEERFYLKGLELESHGEFRSGAYMELARGFGIRDYKFMLGSAKANTIRLKTATEFGRKMLGDPGFASSLVRHALFAVREVAAGELEAKTGRNWLYTELQDRYWQNRKTLITILNYFVSRATGMEHWARDVEAARLLAGYLQNDHTGA